MGSFQQLTFELRPALTVAVFSLDCLDQALPVASVHCVGRGLPKPTVVNLSPYTGYMRFCEMV